MLKFLFISLIVFSLTASSCFAESSHFINGFEDIPLMQGLKQTEDFSFGNEETRYIESQLIATHQKSFSQVKTFYKETLKQFGWNLFKEESNRISFYRENDTLEISKLANSPLKISIILKNRT